ncbi:LOW QUALITY PROTEIN: hypothetical protein N665_0098s0055 [Sinapis alba]|nr:LOW QUALITY PROTEIN: hypothetical protein N665_0098s0055 [Sinapis alba]
MSCYSYLSNFQMEAVKKSAIGVFQRFYELNFTWCAKLVHHLLTHQLKVKKNYEIWSLIICQQPIRLSLVEFGEITGMNCDPFQKEEIFDVDHTEFWKEMEVSTIVGPSLVQLLSVLERCNLEKRKMVGLLCVLHLGVYEISPSRHIPLECTKRVLDYEAFQRYPWGRIWGYESVMGLRELYGNRIGGGTQGRNSSEPALHFDKDIDRKLDNIETLIEAKVEVGNYGEGHSKDAAADERKEDVNSNVNVNENAEVNRKDMFWMVEINSTSHEGLPAQRVVKKSRKAGQKCEDMRLGKKKFYDTKVLKTKIQVPHFLDNASEDETWSDPMQHEKFRDLSDRLDVLAAMTTKMNKSTSPTPSSPPQKRQTKLALSQLFHRKLYCD